MPRRIVRWLALTLGPCLALALSRPAVGQPRSPACGQAVRPIDGSIPFVDTLALRQCLRRAVSGPLSADDYRTALAGGGDSIAVVRLALAGLTRTMKEAQATEEVQAWRAVLALATFADSLAASPVTRFYRTMAAISVGSAMDRVAGCAAAKEAEASWKLALLSPPRGDPGLDPDTLATERRLRAAATRAAARVRTECPAPTRRAP